MRGEEDEELLERIAQVEHEIWCFETLYFLHNAREARVYDWWKRAKTPYKNLSNKEKSKYRCWARRLIKAIKPGTALMVVGNES